ncbi:Hypothetical protein PHPALM_7197 [Phytophthora palmivora]|uniref:Retrotransposon gag domain-containing protein n=1 Tax=Phytophthora palmivora TaxID=4796 RepID=A0A2P4YCY0_9STRA|nr:Hypothetical protein PHPALM_7197 [Phytophthora palmivora]
MPSHIKNAVRMLPPFYSDNTTVDKARTFWDAFERATFRLSDPLRLSVFRDRLKGSTGENWWMYSQIDDFETLKTRFHNQFVCQTPQQMIERLKTTKRSRGMSAEVWGDLISGLCDAAQCFDPQMRYQYFLAGIRNNKSGDLHLLLHAVLLYKNLHLPVEDESGFVEGPTSLQVPENAMMQCILEQIESTQAVQQQILNPARQTRRNTVVAAIPTQPLVQNAPVYLPTAPQAHEVPFYQSVNTAVQQSSSRGIRPDPDLRTQEGVIVCGRCRRVGHGRLSCGRNNLTSH